MRSVSTLSTVCGSYLILEVLSLQLVHKGSLPKTHLQAHYYIIIFNNIKKNMILRRIRHTKMTINRQMVDSPAKQA